MVTSDLGRLRLLDNAISMNARETLKTLKGMSFVNRTLLELCSYRLSDRVRAGLGLKDASRFGID